MTTNTNKTLEFTQIQTILAGLALSQNAKAQIHNLTPLLDEALLKRCMDETTQARQMIEWAGTPPLAAMEGLSGLLELTAIGAMLSPEQLTAVTTFLSSCKRMKGYLKRGEIQNLSIASFGNAFYDMDELDQEINRCIRNNQVEDSATPALREIRRKMQQTQESVKGKLESILRGHKEWFEDGYVAVRNGRYVLPVKKKYKNQLAGSLIDISGTGNTCFIEPAAVRKLQETLSSLEIDEDNEKRKILYTLTALVEDNASLLKINRECMETLDFLFAKGKLSIEMDGRPVEISTNRRILIRQGRHPLLDKNTAIPLDFTVGDGYNGVVVTGPNTGGKTVALKTVGLLSLMAQCGLHVPVAEGSIFSMHNCILSDIGDGQSITENLSTFSSHITNVIDILNHATAESLVLLDELGSGTDPAEGMGIAVSILEELRMRGCLFLATTHYPEIKSYAAKTPGLVNARMAFDRESLKPLYRLELGEAGESCALYIARRLGFPEHLLKRAYDEAYQPGPSTQPVLPAMTFVEETDAIAPIAPASQIKKELPQKAVPDIQSRFQMGDSVMVYPQKEIGIVYEPAGDKGQVIVQMKGMKQPISHKRIKLITPAKELYPEDYDFSILFDTVENRKARHQLNRKHSPGLVAKSETTKAKS